MICRQFNECLNCVIESFYLQLFDLYEFDGLMDAIEAGEEYIDRYFRYTSERFVKEFKADADYQKIDLEPFYRLVTNTIKDHWKLNEDKQLTDAVNECVLRNTAAILIGILDTFKLGKVKGNDLLQEALRFYDYYGANINDQFKNKCKEKDINPDRFTCDREDVRNERRRKKREKEIELKQAKELQQQLFAMKDYLGGVKA